jgi:hypothetical protein
MLFEGSQASLVCPPGKSNMEMKMSKQHWRNDTDGKTEVLGEKDYTALVVHEWVWSTGGMILRGETKVLGEKRYTALVVHEWVWSTGGMILRGETKVLGEKRYTALVADK